MTTVMINDNNYYYLKKGGHCVLLISDRWQIYENFSLSSKILLKEAFFNISR